jgi:hypothetical protein
MRHGAYAARFGQVTDATISAWVAQASGENAHLDRDGKLLA